MTSPTTGPPSAQQVTQALDGVQDPEIHRPITELGMVKNIDIAADGAVLVEVWLTVAGCPLRETITREVTAAVSRLPGVSSVRVLLDVMSDEQRRALQTQLRGGRPEPQIPFAQPTSLTRVYAVASGKGGVGKSSVTVNLAASLAASGQKVGVVDADIYGHSVPRMLGVTGRPTPVENMIMPPSAHGVKVISIGMFTKGNTPVVWRGPMLHRALQQFLADVYWGDLDVLLLDLPPGTGDIAISVGQMLPSAELLVVTTPQLAAAEVAERAGAIASQTHQRVAGVIENMSYLVCAHCGEQTEVFGSGGGASVAAALSRLGGTQVPLLGQVPLDVRLREGGDAGMPLVLSDPDSPASLALRKIADEIGARGRGLAGRHLGLTPGRRRVSGRPAPVRRAGTARAGRPGFLGQVASGSNGGRSPGASSVPFARPGRVDCAAACGGFSVEVVEEVLLHEPLRVQVVELEVGELGAEPFPQVVLRALGDLAQVTQGPPGLGGDLGQLVRPEDDKRDHRENQQLGDGQVEQRSALRRAGATHAVHCRPCRRHPWTAPVPRHLLTSAFRLVSGTD